MIKKIVLIFAIVIAVVLIYAGIKSPEMEVSREISIQSSAEKLFPYINNSQKMNEWMPWKEADPDLKMNYSGPTEGVGSLSSWDSQGQMGTGQAEIIESVLNQSVKTKLTYTKPMNMSQISTMSLSATANGETSVRWSVVGHNSFMFRVIGIFVSMEKMIGKEFEKGLAQLKSIAEKEK